jgi:hypothetical protein
MAVWSEVKISNLTPDVRWDAEHYKPEYLAQSAAMAARTTKPLREVALVSDGNHLSIAEDFGDEGVRYLRGQDLRDFFISDADPIYIPERLYITLNRSHMHAGDVLVGVVGTIGSVGLVTDRHGKLTGNCKLAIVRAKSLPPEYIAAYLASRIGQNEIQRRVRGAVQMGLILPDLKEVPVVLPTEWQRDKVVKAVKGAQAARKRASDTVTAAETLLLSSLGLDHVDRTPSRSYSRSFKDLTAGHRFGAEYYMPCKQRALDALTKEPHKTLRDHASSIRDLWQPEKATKGAIVRNFDLGDALEPFLDDTVAPTPAVEVGSTKRLFKAGDVVVSRLRSYLREIAVVRTTNGIPCVGSSEFIVLRPTGKGLSAETILVYLRCPLVQTILKWSQDGSNHPRFDEDDLAALPVPDRLMQVSTKIEKHVQEAIAARQEATRLLEEAKTMVEESIRCRTGS